MIFLELLEGVYKLMGKEDVIQSTLISRW